MPAGRRDRQRGAVGGAQPARLSRDAPRHRPRRPVPAARRIARPLLRPRRPGHLHQFLLRHRQRQPGHPLDSPDHRHRLRHRRSTTSPSSPRPQSPRPPTRPSSMARLRWPGRPSTPRQGRSCAIGCWPVRRQPTARAEGPPRRRAARRCAGGRCWARTSAGSRTAEDAPRPATRRCRPSARSRPIRHDGRGRRR